MADAPRITVGDEPFDVRVQPERGWFIETGESWDGYRVRYRRPGERRWSSLLLVDHDHPPTELELAAAVGAHRSTGRDSLRLREPRGGVA